MSVKSKQIHLILGGARSGKSSLAERVAEQSGLPVVYVATAESKDTEMQQRIVRHQNERPEHWQTIEQPLDLVSVINTYREQEVVVLVDCLTLWLCNWLTQFDLDSWLLQKEAFLACLTDLIQSPQSRMRLLLVSNEVGHGIVPMGELNRQFVDESGWLHQAIASVADNVDFVMAGIALSLKPGGQTV